jgi:hypothetical protein
LTRKNNIFFPFFHFQKGGAVGSGKISGTHPGSKEQRGTWLGSGNFSGTHSPPFLKMEKGEKDVVVSVQKSFRQERSGVEHSTIAA